MRKKDLATPLKQPAAPAPREVTVAAWVAVQYAPYIRGILAVLFAGIVAMMQACPLKTNSTSPPAEQPKAEGRSPPAKLR